MNNNKSETLEDELISYYENVNFLEYNDTVERISLGAMEIVSKKDEKLKKAFEKDNLFSYYIDNKSKLTDEMLGISPGDATYRQFLNLHLIMRCITNLNVDIEELVRFTLNLNQLIKE